MPNQENPPTQLTWRNLTKKYQKEQIIFYLLTIASALLSVIIDQNSIGNLTDKIRGGQWNPEFKIFSQVIIGKKGRLGNWFRGGTGLFQLFMLLFTGFYCSVVFAHVFYAYYFENKINRALRAQLMKKFFRLRDSCDKKNVLNIFNNDVHRLTYNVMFVPNQLFYFVLTTIFNLLSIYITNKSEANSNYSPIWAGLVYSLFTLGVVIPLEYILYWADLRFQKKLSQQTRKEDIIINNRELIIKKGLTTNTCNTYRKIVDQTQDEADRRYLVYTRSWVIPSFFLTPYCDFFLLMFLRGTGPSTLLTSKLFGKIFGGIKKMVERLRDYPYYFSAAKRINEFLAQPERDDIQKNRLISEPIKSLDFRRVVFGYEKDKLVLNGLDLQFQTGKINYLRGENGFGKSTLINLLFGLHQLWAGEIWINDKYQLSEVNLLAWREKIAYAEHQNLVENGLSTGQKQLVDLASIFSQENSKEIFIFDEADNALDEQNREKFRHQCEKLARNKVVILVSHHHKNA